MILKPLKKKNVIFELEALAVLMAVTTLLDPVALAPNDRVVLFIDNDAVLARLVSVAGSLGPDQKIFSGVLEWEFAAGSVVWFERVPSHANPVDAPSRNDCTSLNAKLRINVDPVEYVHSLTANVAGPSHFPYLAQVVSVDSTALHVLEDLVLDFRSQGVHIAFAMVGNRIDRTFRKAGLTNFVGEKWFFHSVHDAVVGCLRHQKAKRKLISTRTATMMTSAIPAASTDCGSEPTVVQFDTEGSDLEKGAPELPLSRSQEDLLDIEDNPVHVGNEIGHSNEMHHSCTVIFINIMEDIPMIMSDITAIFQRRGLTVCRANIEAMGDDGLSTLNVAQPRRAAHVYHIKSLLSHGKLKEKELSDLKAELQGIQRICGYDSGMSSSIGRCAPRAKSRPCDVNSLNSYGSEPTFPTVLTGRWSNALVEAVTDGAVVRRHLPIYRCVDEPIHDLNRVVSQTCADPDRKETSDVSLLRALCSSRSGVHEFERPEFGAFCLVLTGKNHCWHIHELIISSEDNWDMDRSETCHERLETRFCYEGHSWDVPGIDLLMVVLVHKRFVMRSSMVHDRTLCRGAGHSANLG
eukprot:s2024_g9.t1